MNRIDVLIQQHCPNGVDFIPLGEVCASIKTGKLNANAQEEKGKYPFFTCDAEPYRINTYAFDCEAILVTGNGSQVGHINYYNGKFNAYQRTYVLSSFDKSISIFYALHYFKAHLKEYILIKSKKGSVPYITLPMLLDFIIPIPPLPVQEEIVRVLDTFTELQAELQAELQKRLQQYNYYRDQLLAGDESFQQCKLIDLLSQPITDGPHTTPQFFQTGVPFVSVEAVWDGRIHFEKKRGYISPDFDKECSKKYKPRRDDVFMVKSGSTTGKVAYVDTDESFNIWSPLAAMRVNDKTSSRYLFHLLQTSRVQEQVVSKSSQGSQPNLSMRVLEQFDVAVPSLTRQLEIVSLLDRFDTLTCDLSQGLPAEIEKRRQQYEYYRDKLLTFKRKEA